VFSLAPLNGHLKLKIQIMKTLSAILCILSLSCIIIAQTTVSGKVTDKKGSPLVGVNVYFKNTYDGTISDLKGEFKAVSDQDSLSVMIFSFIGYESLEYVIDSSSSSYLTIRLMESSQSIDAVTITAGCFAAGDEQKATVLSSLDIYTTAGSVGDVFGALTTLPGTQRANDDGRLLVRGGEAYETKTMIDGLLAGKPYYSKVPDVATRGRFSPSLFSGTLFNTGGYSAAYGQAMSSVLELNTKGIATQDLLSLSLMSIGAGADFTQCGKNSSLSIMGQYINMDPYYGMVNNEYDWVKPSESLSGSAIYRYKNKDGGLLKAYITGDTGETAFKRDDGVNPEKYLTKVNSSNYYGNVTFNHPLGEKALVKTGASVTIDRPDVVYGDQQISTRETNAEARVMLVHDLKDVKLSYGLSNTFTAYDQDYSEHPDSALYHLTYTDYLTGAFAEAEIMFSSHLAFRPGLRYEYSSVLNRFNLAPRLALALSTGKESQLSASYGHFYQNPQSDILKFSSDLNYERAEHYILGFQSGRASKRLFRLESYYKKYRHLVRYDEAEFYDADYYNNSGYGEALGLDVFWKDTKSIKHLEYWFSYSYINTHRKYQDFDFSAQPDFISDHSFSVVSKYFVSSIRCLLGATYWWASGRNWYEETKEGKNSHQGAATQQLNLNISYLTQIFNHSTIIHCSLSNALGANNVYGYNEGPNLDENGDYVYLPITNDIKQYAFVGLFITL
jgi:hypothetical protein